MLRLTQPESHRDKRMMKTENGNEFQYEQRDGGQHGMGKIAK